MLDADLDGQQELEQLDEETRASLRVGARHLLRNFRSWLLPPSVEGQSENANGTKHQQQQASALYEDGTTGLVQAEHGDQDDRTGSISIAVGLGGSLPYGKGVFRGIAEPTSMADFNRAEQIVLSDLSRHYVALAIGCWILLTVLQGISLGLLVLWEWAPVIFGLSLLLATVLVYWLVVWRLYRIRFTRLWMTPYPYAATASILGSLSQHTIYLAYNGFNAAHLVISFVLVEAFYIILVSATYQDYMNKWSKYMHHRRICFRAILMDRKRNQRRMHHLKTTSSSSPIPTSNSYRQNSEIDPIQSETSEHH